MRMQTQLEAIFTHMAGTLVVRAIIPLASTAGLYQRIHSSQYRTASTQFCVISWVSNINYIVYTIISSLVPVGKCHHHIERGQEEHEVEEGIAVRHAVLLVVINLLAPGVLILSVSLLFISILAEYHPLIRLHRQSLDVAV